MKDALSQRSFDLAVNIFSYYQWLIQEKKEYVISKQILRSGTSIGANIREAKYGVSRADFINKLQISLKEAAETEYWLELLEYTGYFDEKFKIIKSLLDETKRMLVSTLKTTKTDKE